MNIELQKTGWETKIHQLEINKMFGRRQADKNSLDFRDKH